MSLAIKVARVQSQGSGRVRPGVGDPGFFGFLGKGLRTITGIASKVLPGPLGMIAGGVSSALGGGQPKTVSQAQVAPQVSPRLNGGGISNVAVQQALQQAQGTPTGRIIIDPRAAAPGGAPLFARERMNGGNLPPSGYHWNKSDYFLKDGTFVEKGTKIVKNRRRNSLNPRALDRAMGRVTGAKKAAKKLSRITIRSSCPAKR